MTMIESTLNIMRVGIGPSSSYSTAPMTSAFHFVEELKKKHLFDQVSKVNVKLHGSMSTIGRVRMTNRSVLLGLSGSLPETVDIDSSPEIIESIQQTGKIKLGGTREVELKPQKDIIHLDQQINGKSGITFEAYGKSTLDKLYSHTYYKIHGGVVTDDANYRYPIDLQGECPYPFSNATGLLNICKETNFSVSTVIMKNEVAIQRKQPEEIIKDFEQRIWKTMKVSIKRGLQSEGILPGELKLARRAPPLYRILKSSKSLKTDPMSITDWVGLYALAVSEENAAGSRIVATPTGGACGVVPAILEYYNHFVHSTTPEERARYFLTCGAIGLLYKRNASISGSVVGCQGEIGVASSMAAAGLTELLTSNPWKVMSAAEHAMEHSLGMTCDPAKGYVQVPCIERNAIGALKALMASRMATLRNEPSKISLDAVISTMFATGKDLKEKYKKTGHGPIGCNTV